MLTNEQKSVPNDLFINNEARLNWHMARLECVNRGVGWDLVIIESKSKLDFITNLTDCGTTYWTGQTDRNGYLVGVNEEHVKFANWDTHQNMLNPGSNNALGTESCVRLRGNQINDADCDQLSKGYICEFTIQKCKSINQLEFTNFIIVPPPSGISETVNFEEAKEKCRSLPGYRQSSWRLLSFRKQTRKIWYARILQLLGANCLTKMSWWVDFETGFEKYKFDESLSKIPTVWVDPVNGEILKKRDQNHCTILQNGTITNELCYKKYQGQKRRNVGMGYICEKVKKEQIPGNYDYGQ